MNMTFLFFFLMIRRPPRSTLFPYTTLFRSHFAAAEWNGRHFWLVDTGGLVLAASDPLGRAVRAQVELAIAESDVRSEEHTSELQSQSNLVCRLLLEKKKNEIRKHPARLYRR